MKRSLLPIIILVFISGCKETLDNYCGYRIIQTSRYGGFRGNVMWLEKKGEVKTVETYTLYFEKYSIGDTITYPCDRTLEKTN